ncbi:unnamed protein product [Miscanthus lutarioriparius]|uniref:Uncharacterized protein n=1 Tax=Miscanthus lutarioriparius TaxID=422564 RepID=A0A811Q571_9POAL|nr:unnamed protein product [Miscanthus lutarioriparius]
MDPAASAMSRTPPQPAPNSAMDVVATGANCRHPQTIGHHDAAASIAVESESEASSRTCSSRSDDVVPNETYSTDDDGCVSSQSRHSCRARAPAASPTARAGAGEEHRAERLDGEQPAAVGRRDPLERVEEVALEHATGVDDHAGSGHAPALLPHPPGEHDELRGGAGIRRVEHEAVAAQQGVLPVRPPDVVGGGEAVHAEDAVVEDNDAAVGRGELRQQCGQRGPRAGAVGLEERLHMHRERGARVRGGGLVRGHIQRGLLEVWLRRREVDGEPPRGEEQGQV